VWYSMEISRSVLHVVDASGCSDEAPALHMQTLADPTKSVCQDAYSTLSWFFFWFNHYSHATYQIMARLYTVRFLSAVRAVASRCKLPLALRPGLSQEDVKGTKGITKERRASVKDKGKKNKRKASPPKPFLQTP